MDQEEAVMLIKSYVDKVRKAGYRIKAAYMFGSTAKGLNGPDSDIDVALIIEDLGNSFDAQVELMKLRRKVDLRIEPHPFGSMEGDGDSALLQEVLRTGIKVA